MKKNSSFDAVLDHLEVRGQHEPAAPELQGDLEMVVRRVERVQGLAAEFGSIELSPYMQALLQVTREARTASAPAHRAAALSV